MLMYVCIVFLFLWPVNEIRETDRYVTCVFSCLINVMCDIFLIIIVFSVGISKLININLALTPPE